MNETVRNTETETATALVEAARRLFAEHGYDGTSVRAITGEAGANLGAITYHFGSKRELYDRVVGSVVAPLAERVEQAATAGGDVLDRAERIVRTYFQYLVEHPELPQLMMQELALGAVPGDAVAEPLKRVHGVVTRLIVEGQATGRIREGPPPVLGIFILSVPVHMGILHRPLQILGVNVLDADTRAPIVEAAVAFVRGGLSAPASSDDGSGVVPVDAARTKGAARAEGGA